MATEILVDTHQQVGKFHVAKVKLQKVIPSSNRPDGFKLNCVLIDIRTNQPVLILDNHSPFGYHIHPEHYQIITSWILSQ